MILLHCCRHFFFFFQAEDGIRDIGVTGVQTCALPICDDNFDVEGVRQVMAAAKPVYRLFESEQSLQADYPDAGHDFPPASRERSEERRVGKECRSRWSPYH